MVGAPNDAPLSSFLARLVGALVLSRFVRQKMVFFIAKFNKQDLTIVRELMATGKITPVIDKHYKLSEPPEAFRYMEGHARGKVIITLQHGNDAQSTGQSNRQIEHTTRNL
jgi:NADPH:quinone reductase-like Zn-dependent oxidoreductase